MSDKQPEMELPEQELTLMNFPPNGENGEIRTVAFGPVGPMQLLLQIREPQQGDDTMKIDVVVSNAAANDEVSDFLREAAELLQAIAERASDELRAASDAATEAYNTALLQGIAEADES